ncbi:MAG: KdsC family phosphatase [Thermodesulfobacteriota bacterium]
MDLTDEKLKSIELVLLDVDGVLTDGSIVYDDAKNETKTFNVKDGFGIRLLMKSGVQVGIVTGRSSMALRHRCDDLGIALLFDGVKDKAALLPRIMELTGVSESRIAFVGDDLPDLPIMKKVGLAVAVGDGHELVREHAHMTTRASGGKGAVREVCEAILVAKGMWNSLCESFLV